MSTNSNSDSASKPASTKVAKIKEGVLGNVRELSFGTLDQQESQDRFKTFCRLSYNEEEKARTLSYVRELNSRRFRIDLPGHDGQNSTAREWVDLDEPNIAGIIFEDSHDQAHKVVYFCVNTPPEFYRRYGQATLQTKADLSPIMRSLQLATMEENEAGAAKSERNVLPCRISHPSILHDYEGEDVDICGVPWVVQYSRVLKVKYQELQVFSVPSYEPCLSEAQSQALFVFASPAIISSERSVTNIVKTIRKNMTRVQTVNPPICRLGVLKLLYNCHVPATSTEVTSLMDQLPNATSFETNVASRLYTNKVRRLYAEALDKISQYVELSHIRALRRLYAKARKPRLPTSPIGTLHEPFKAISDAFNEDNFKLRVVSRPKSRSLGVFDVLVYPSHIGLRGPRDPPSNSITDRYAYVIDRFVRVIFC
ncbi:hypothetical protein MMC07_009539 [Pseudocyphellaria aurata]|nr:hypothetical protein [Pseudocyphellaria aurata]